MSNNIEENLHDILRDRLLTGSVMNFSQWDDHLEIYPDDLIIKVSLIVKTGDIHKLTDVHSPMYAPDPSSSTICTIDGCGATLKEYHKMFEEDTEWYQRAVNFTEKVHDISEVMRMLDLDMKHNV